MNRLATCILLGVVAVAGAQPRIPVLRPGESWPSPVKVIEVAPIVPVEWRLLAQPAVRKDLELNPAQTKSLDLVLALQSVSNAAFYWGTRGSFTSDMVKSLKEFVRDEFWTQSLTKAQRMRLRQIEYQLKEREFGAHAALAMAARDLGLRTDQLEDVSSIKGQRVEELARLVTSGERFDKVKTKVASTNGDTYDKIAEMLTRTQRERLKELKGKVFAASIDFTQVLEPVAKGSKTPSTPKLAGLKSAQLPPGFRLLLTRYPSANFGLYDLELRYLGNKEIRGELKVNAEQAAKLDAALEGWTKKHLEFPGLDLDRAAQLHDYTSKAIGDILSADQKGRLDEIMMWRRFLIGPEAMCGHPAAVSALKITPIQLAKLRENESIADALTTDQTLTLIRLVEKILAKPVEFPTGVVDPLLGRNEQQLVADSARQKVSVAFARRFLIISDRLKLSEEQIKKLRDLAEDEPKFFELIQRELGLADTVPMIGAGRGQTAAVAVADQYREALEEQCWNVLDDKQQSMAKQIYGRRK